MQNYINYCVTSPDAIVTFGNSAAAEWRHWKLDPLRDSEKQTDNFAELVWVLRLCLVYFCTFRLFYRRQKSGKKVRRREDGEY